jgi:putative ABC transport system permease protein
VDPRIGMDALHQEARQALRALRKAPGFAAVALATLALGIGTSTAILTVVDGILMRPLAVREQGRVLIMWSQHLRAGSDHVPLSYADFLEYRSVRRPLEDVAAVDYNGSWPRPVQLEGGDAKFNVAFVSGNLFRVLGAVPEIGRGLVSEDDQAGAPPAVVISRGLWEREFGKDSAVVGRVLRFFGKQAEIVGVMPRGFDYPEGTEVWAPVIPFTAGPDGKSSWVFVHFVGRLAEGATPGHVKSDLNAFLGREGVPYPAGRRDMSGVVSSLEDVLIGPVRPLLALLGSAVALLFLVACATVANLALVRAMARFHEFATRSALGASRWRIVRQLLTESTVLALLGGALAVGVAYVAIRGFISLAPAEIPRLDQVHLDLRLLAATAFLSFTTALLFGLAPALWSSRAAARQMFMRGARSGSTTQGAERVRRAFVTFQIALAMVVLIGAGLLVESFRRLRNVELGFAHDNVLVVELALGYGASVTADYVQLVDQLAERVQTLPGVAAATPAALPPFTGTSGLEEYFVKEGHNPAEGVGALVNIVPAPPRYFRTLEIPLLRGRDFTDRDIGNATPVAIVSQELARRTWPGQDPIGQRIRLGRDPGQPLRTVVGLVGDTRYRDYSEIRPSIYLPPRQFSSPGLVYLLVRTVSDPALLAQQVRRVVPDVAPGLYVPTITTVEGAAASPLARPRMSTVLMTGFALVTLLLAALGLYSVMATFVEQNRRELGVRMALGAAPGDIRRVVLWRALRLTIAGLGTGAVVAVISTRALRSLLFDVSPTDPRVLVTTAVLLAVVAVLACIIPTRRATRLDPATILRSE